MLLQSTSLEKLVIRTLASPQQEVSSVLFSSLRSEHFGSSAMREVFDRMAQVARDSGRLAQWRDLLEDPKISESVRQELRDYEGRPLTRIGKAKRVVNRLNEYRQMRVLYETADNIGRTLKQEKVDVAEMLDSVTNNITQARTGTSNEGFYHHGKKGDLRSYKMLKSILKGRKLRFIPTGFQAFDRVNMGIPIGSCFVMAATSGGGKCLTGSTIIPTSQGEMTLEDMWNSLDTTITSEGSRVFDKDLLIYTAGGVARPVESMYRTKGKTIRITTSDGKIIEGLPAHQLLVFNGEGVPEFRRLDQIKEDDEMPAFDHEEVVTLLRQTAEETTCSP